MPDATGSWFQATKRDTAGVSTGKVSDEPLTFTSTKTATAGGVSTTLLAAAAAGTITQTVTLSILANADTGVYINFGGAATTNNYLIQPGGSLTVTTLQSITGLKAGTAEVTVYLVNGVKT